MPTEQGEQADAPPREYSPGLQEPEQAAVASPEAFPNLPAEQLVQLLELPSENLPAGQAPLHVDTVSPVVLPKYPAWHGPEHPEVAKPTAEP